MANVQIRDVPEEVHRHLRARAAAAGLSLSAYLRIELGRLAARSSSSPEVLRRARERHDGVALEAIVDALHEERGQR